MGKVRDEVVQPIEAHRVAYDQLYADYRTLYDYFGRGSNDVMKRLKKLRREVRGGE
jgi:L-ribulokinase